MLTCSTALHCATLLPATRTRGCTGILLNASSTREDVAYHLCLCARSHWLEAWAADGFLPLSYCILPEALTAFLGRINNWECQQVGSSPLQGRIHTDDVKSSVPTLTKMHTDFNTHTLLSLTHWWNIHRASSKLTGPQQIFTHTISGPEDICSLIQIFISKLFVLSLNVEHIP